MRISGPEERSTGCPCTRRRGSPDPPPRPTRSRRRRSGRRERTRCRRRMALRRPPGGCGCARFPPALRRMRPRRPDAATGGRRWRPRARPAMRPLTLLPLSEKERSFVSQPLYQPADQLILSPAAVPCEPDAGALGNGQRRRHRRALHEYEVVAVGEPLHGDAFRLVSDRHPKELANGDRDVQAGERPSFLVVVLVGSVVLGLYLEAPREGSGELPVDFEVIEAEDPLVRTGPRPAPRSRRPERRTRRPSIAVMWSWRSIQEVESSFHGFFGTAGSCAWSAAGTAAARMRLRTVRRSPIIAAVSAIAPSGPAVFLRRGPRRRGGRPLPGTIPAPPGSRDSRACFRSAASSTSIARPVCPTESRAIAQT